MAKKADDWLITHIVTAEPIKPKKEEWGIVEYFGLAVVIFIVLAVIGSFGGH
jgi:hypothetical protein